MFSSVAEHGHDHGHTHEGRYEVECVAVDRESANADRPGKVVGEALLRLLYKKNVVTQAEIHKNIEALEMANTSMKGADLVVYAWKDPAFKERLIADGTFLIYISSTFGGDENILGEIWRWLCCTTQWHKSVVVQHQKLEFTFFFCVLLIVLFTARKAALEFGMATSNQNATTILRVVANSPMVHNVIVCTLCSCYPVGLLGEYFACCFLPLFVWVKVYSECDLQQSPCFRCEIVVTKSAVPSNLFYICA